MIKVTKTITAEIPFNGDDVADLFCQLDSYDQAGFFNSIALKVKEWKSPFDNQMFAVSVEADLTAEGRKIMKTIGDYSAKS